MDAAPFDPLQIQRHGILKRHAGHGKALLYPRRRQKPIERIPIPNRCRGRGRAPVPGGEGFGFAGPLSGGRRFPAIATGRSALHQLQRFPVSPIDGTEGTQRVFTSRGMKIRPSDLPLRLPFQLCGDLRQCHARRAIGSPRATSERRHGLKMHASDMCPQTQSHFHQRPQTVGVNARRHGRHQHDPDSRFAARPDCFQLFGKATPSAQDLMGRIIRRVALQINGIQPRFAQTRRVSGLRP